MTTATKAPLPDLNLPRALHVPSRSNQASTLLIEKIHTDGGTQTRAELNGDVVLDYAERMANGATFPPVDVFFDGKDYWMADGFHRIAAVLANGGHRIEALVHQGTRRDAILWSVSANARHGLRRTNADKRRAVETILADEEWRKWSDSEIARRCEVTIRFVGKVREELSLNSSKIDTRTVTRSGVTYPMRTEHIGRAAPTPAPRYGPVDEPEPALPEPEWQDVIEAEFTPEAPAPRVAPPPSTVDLVAKAKALKAEKADATPAEKRDWSKHAISCTNSEEAVLRAIMALYLGGNRFAWDVTYSEGKLWNGLPGPLRKSDIAPCSADVEEADCRHLPALPNSVNSIFFDPPHVPKNVQRENARLGIIESRFSGCPTINDLWDFYSESLKEFWRVLRVGGVVTCKVMDIISGGEFIATSVHTIMTAKALGFKLLYQFVVYHDGHGAMSPNMWNQKNPRHNHFYYLVFAKQ